MKTTSTTRTASTLRLAPAALCMALVAALAPAAYAADALPEARSLIDRHIEAVGGVDAMRAASVATIKGRVEMPGAGVSGPITVASSAHDRVASRVELAGIGEIRSGINGSVVWSMDPFTGPRLLDGKERAGQIEATHPDAAVRDPSFISSARTTGLVELGGQSCYRVALVWRSGRESADCYSPDSGLLVATESVQVSPMGEMAVTTTMGEYKRMAGLMVATRSEQQVMGQTQVITVDSIETGEPDASLFEMPAAIKALSQATPGGPGAMNRVLVAGVPLVWMAMLYTAAQGGGRWPLIALGVASLVLVGVVIRRTGNVANRTNSRADEFQRARRDSVHRLAYWWLSAPVGLLLGLGVGRFEKLHLQGEPLVIPADQLPLAGVVIWGMFVAWTWLPSAILALSSPPPLEDQP